MSRLQERIENFHRAFKLFELSCNAFRQDETNDINKLALMQSFEIIVELGWKVLKDYLDTKGIRALTPNDAIKEAFSAEIISDGQIWLSMIKDRNTISHEYNINKVDEILIKICSLYNKELTNFNKQIEDFNG